jgi:hypothetical protein
MRIIAACVLLSGIVSADDMSKGVPFPGYQLLKLSASVVSARVTLRVDSDIVEVTQRLEGLRAGETLRLTTPRFGWMGEGEPYPDRHFPELKILVNGSAATIVADTIVAFAKDGITPISDLLQKAGIDPLAVAGGEPPVLTITDKAVEKRLHDLQAISKDDGLLLAKSAIQRELQFRIPAGERVEIKSIYKVRPAFEVQPASAVKALAAKYCVANPAEIEGSLRGARTAVFTAYEIPVGLRTQAVSGPVTIQVEQDPQKSAVAFCGANGQVVPDAMGVVRILRIRP